jgi:hypothetical protein
MTRPAALLAFTGLVAGMLTGCPGPEKCLSCKEPDCAAQSDAGCGGQGGGGGGGSSGGDRVDYFVVKSVVAHIDGAGIEKSGSCTFTTTSAAADSTLGARTGTDATDGNLQFSSVTKGFGFIFMNVNQTGQMTGTRQCGTDPVTACTPGTVPSGFAWPLKLSHQADSADDLVKIEASGGWAVVGCNSVKLAPDVSNFVFQPLPASVFRSSTAPFELLAKGNGPVVSSKTGVSGNVSWDVKVTLQRVREDGSTF